MENQSGDDAKALELTRALLGRVPSLRGACEQVVRAGPARASSADRDFSGDLGSLPWVLATSVTVVGSEPLLIWHNLLNSGNLLPTYSQFVLMRATIEALVTVRWLLAPSNRPERVGRAVALQLADYDERRKFENSFFDLASLARTGDAKTAVDRLAELRTAASAEGILPAVVPSATDRVRDFAVMWNGDGEWVYRILSASTHALPWGLVLTRHVETRPHYLPGMSEAYVRPSALPTLALTRVAVETLAKTVAEVADYSGRVPG